MQTFPNLKLVFCVAAGVDNFDLSGIPEHIPVVRMIEPGLEAGMTEYVLLTVLALNLLGDALRDAVDPKNRKG